MMKLKNLVVIPIIVSLIVNVNIASAWVLVDQSGEWEIAQHDHFKSSTSNLVGKATLVFEQTYENFSYWECELKYTNLAEGGFWMFGRDVKAKTVLTLTDGNHTIKITYFGMGTKWFFAWGYYRNYLIDAEVDGKVILTKEWDYVTGEPYYLHFWIFENDQNQTEIHVQAWQGDEVVSGASATLDYLFDTVTLRQEVTKSGKGWIEGVKPLEVISSEVPSELAIPVPPEEMPIQERIWYRMKRLAEQILETLPEPMRNFLEGLGEAFGYIHDTFSLMLNVVIAFAPMFPILYAMYLIGVVIKCVNQGSIEPLYDHLISIYNILATLWNAMINAIRLLWSVLKFWG